MGAKVRLSEHNTKQKAIFVFIINCQLSIILYLCRQKRQLMYFTGIIIAISTFLTIGIWHPIVIKTEYHWGTRPWVVYLVIGLSCIVGALFIENTIVSAVVGVFGASALWGIGELFAQRRRVKKGWFPMNPKRKKDYEDD
jgi:hypothetical protein